MSRTASLCPAGIVTTADSLSLPISVPVGIFMRAMTTSSSGCSRMVSSAACSMGLPLQRMSGHELVGVNPARQRPDALEPGADLRVIGPGHAEFVRPVEISAHRQIGDGRLVAD